MPGGDFHNTTQRSKISRPFKDNATDADTHFSKPKSSYLQILENPKPLAKSRYEKLIQEFVVPSRNSFNSTKVKKIDSILRNSY
jgi:hypothetical protein